MTNETKTKVIILASLNLNPTEQKNEIGYIDGYVTHEDTIYAIVIVDGVFRKVRLNDLRVYDKKYTVICIHEKDFIKEDIVNIIEEKRNPTSVGFRIITKQDSFWFGTYLGSDSLDYHIKEEEWREKMQEAINIWRGDHS